MHSTTPTRRPLFLPLAAMLALSASTATAQDRLPAADDPNQPPAAIMGVTPTDGVDQDAAAAERTLLAEESELRELEVLGRLQLRVSPGTRWQVERPLREGLLFLVLSPAPPRLEQQLQPYRVMGDLRVSVERQAPRLAVVRIEQESDSVSSLMVHVDDGRRGARSDHLTMVRAQRGAVGDLMPLLQVHVGRMRRPTPAERFCSQVRLPLHIELRDDDPHATAFHGAEELMAAGQFEAALTQYREFAAPLTAPVKAQARIDGKIQASLTASELATVRIGDVAACMGELKIATLRYEVIREARSHPLRSLAEARWADLAWPYVPRTLARQIVEALPSWSPKDPIGRRRRLHGATLALMIDRPETALDLIAAELDPPPPPTNTIDKPEPVRPLPPELIHNLKLLQSHALSVISVRAIEQRDDTALVVHLDRNGPALWRHPRALSLAIEGADAYRRLLLPDMCIELLQLTMKRVPDSARDELLLATLGRCYRDAGDTFRSERTLSYLVEAMRAAGSGWLGRREEATISLAATEVALDSERWGVARRWLDRALPFDPSPSVKALAAYVRGRELQKLGRDEEATEQLLAAAQLRHWITPLRRAQVVLDAVNAALAQGREAQAETYLRLLMAETAHQDTEREACYRLALVLHKRGQADKARALLRDLTLRDTDDTWGQLALDDLDRLDFEQRRARTIARMGLDLNTSGR